MEFYQILLIVAGALVFLFAAVLFAGAAYLYRFAIVRPKPLPRDENELPFEQMMHKNKKEYYLPLVQAGVDWMRAHRSEAEEIYINAYDGITLHAALFSVPAPQGVVVLSHGFHSSGEADFGPAMSFYRNRGYVTLLIDHRGHGRSEGRHVCFGVKERYDLRDWLRFAAGRFPGQPLWLSGISMGCASAMLASELPDLPDTFCGVIADCGYDSPYGEVRWFVKNVFRMPTFFLPVADLYCRVFAHFSMKSCSVTGDADKIRVPVLYLHGTEDHVVPIDNAKRICAALGDRARLLVTKGALHGCSLLENPETVQNEVCAFLARSKNALPHSSGNSADAVS